MSLQGKNGLAVPHLQEEDALSDIVMRSGEMSRQVRPSLASGYTAEIETNESKAIRFCTTIGSSL